MGLEEDAAAILRERLAEERAQAEKARLASLVLAPSDYPQVVTELIHMLQRDRPEPTTLHSHVRDRTTMLGLGSPRRVYEPVDQGWVLTGMGENANLLGVAAVTTSGIVYEGWSPTVTHGGLVGAEYRLAEGFLETFTHGRRTYFVEVRSEQRLKGRNNAAGWALRFAERLLAHKAGQPLRYGSPGVF